MPHDIQHLDANFAPVEVSGGLHWFNVLDLGLQGQGWAEVDSPFDRLPARMREIVRPPVWELSTHSAGLHVRFRTDSPRIAARWTLRYNAPMPHMPETGSSGIDLYVLENGRWRWAGIGTPHDFPDNEAQLLGNLPSCEREYLLYLPLYNGVTSVQIGLEPDAGLATGSPWTGGAKPVCFYGTSITHGGCANRPGMAYPAQLGRRLQMETINIGFSGNALMDLELAELFTQLDVAAYVLDAFPNMSPELIRERMAHFIGILRVGHPATPIVIVENVILQTTQVDTPTPWHLAQNDAAHEVLASLQADGMPNIHLVPCDNLLGDDWEGTVDGIHPTDLGFIRMTDALEPHIRAALGK